MLTKHPWALYIVLFGCAVVAVGIGLSLVGTRVNQTFPDPAMLKSMPKPDIHMVPTYPNTVGTVKFSSDPDHPCSMQDFLSADKPDTVRITYRTILLSDGWEECKGTLEAGEICYGNFKYGYMLDGTAKSASVPYTQVSLHLCVPTR